MGRRHTVREVRDTPRSRPEYVVIGPDGEYVHTAASKAAAERAATRADLTRRR